jgi:hypothetical protein
MRSSLSVAGRTEIPNWRGVPEFSGGHERP